MKGGTNIPRRLLIIDDDIDLLMLLERRLLKEGHVIETAASLPEAEEILGYYKPHLLLLDINVGGDDGRKLSLKLKMQEHTKAVKILIMSGYDYSRTRSVLFGADDFITKPLAMDYLLQRITFHLQQQGALKVL